MGQTLRKHLGAIRTLEPGMYCTTDGRVSISCPECGSIDTIKADAIDPSGRVAHRYKCLTVTCPWRDYLTLESWRAAG
jgi:hypothetical protein